MLLKKILKNRVNQLFIRLISLIFLIPYIFKVKKLKLNILDAENTIKFIQNNRISIGRFGDGEFNIIFKNKSIGFQIKSSNLQNELSNIKENSNFKIAIPHALESTRDYKLLIKTFWWRYVVFNFSNLEMFCKSHDNFFLDTNFSRIITEFKDKKEINRLIGETCKIWKDRNIVIVEGEYTRFGVGNDLLKGANTISRIIAPSQNAYSKINEIYNETINIVRELEDPLILISLGPTATCLAYRFSSSCQAIDIGHFDLQYQYLQNGYYHKVKVDNRYDNEMINGDKVKKIKDSIYLSEIKAIVK